MSQSARLGGLAEAEGLGGLTKRPRPAFGPRPTSLFSGALSLTIAYVALAVFLSAPWRSDLEAAIGPIAAWLIPTLLAYIPALIIGFLAFTLILSPYRFPRLHPPSGLWPEGEWPSVTLMVAALNEEEAITPTIERIANLTYPGPIDLPHEWAYLPDVAAALVRLAAIRERLGTFETYGFPGHAVTGRDFITAIARASGRGLQVKRMTWWLIHGLRPIVPICRELSEMAYLWHEPHRIDGRKLTAAIGEVARTPLDVAVARALQELGAVA